MAEVLRTVRLLDRRPGEPTNEVREVAGYILEKNVPLPRHAAGRFSPLLDAILALEPGESLVDRTQAKEQRYKARKRHGKHVSFCVDKIKEGEHRGKYRIWRLK